jgi:hypothetical protein
MIYSLVFSSHTYYYNNKQNKGGKKKSIKKKQKKELTTRIIIQIKHLDNRARNIHQQKKIRILYI